VLASTLRGGIQKCARVGKYLALVPGKKNEKLFFLIERRQGGSTNDSPTGKVTECVKVVGTLTRVYGMDPL